MFLKVSKLSMENWGRAAAECSGLRVKGSEVKGNEGQ